eukprot:6210809-Pleurochrysis_carterae.AAC.7
MACAAAALRCGALRRTLASGVARTLACQQRISLQLSIMEYLEMSLSARNEPCACLPEGTFAMILAFKVKAK